MKRIIFILIIVLLGNALRAQYVYTIKADSVKITNTCDTAELIIENHTQMVPGFLFNKGRGRTEFKRIAQLDDTSVVVGGDTIHLGRGNKNFANADLTFTGDHIHDGANHILTLQNFDAIDMYSTAGEGMRNANMALWQGLYVTVDNYADNRNAYMRFDDRRLELKISDADGEQSDLVFKKGELNFRKSVYNQGAFLGSAGMNAFLSDNFGTFDLNIYDRGGNFQLVNESLSSNFARINFWHGDSIVIGCGDEVWPTEFAQTPERFEFKHKNKNKNNDFRLIGLPATSSATDSMLVVDDNGQVKKRPQSSQRTSSTVTGSAYTVPAGIDVVFVNYTAGQATITLPAGTLDREITIKNLHTANTVIIAGLDTNDPNSIGARGAITVKYTGSAWVGISKY